MPASCFHEKPGSIRKFKRGRSVFFGIQCPDCLKLDGPKLAIDNLDGPEGKIHPNDVPLAEIRRSFQGGGNSKARKKAAYYRSAAWKSRKAQRHEIDKYTCQKCFETPEDPSSLECHHLTYENFGHERMEDLQSLCKDCHRIETEGRFLA